MQESDREAKQQELENLRVRLSELEADLSGSGERWESKEYYAAYYATTGFMLGLFGAVTSLLFNVVGSALVEQHPLRLIQVYLTFPLGERALQLESGIALTTGCCLYIATGMLLGIPFYMILTRYTADSTFFARLAVASLLGVIVWLVNFYAILSWLQPLLFGGRWIVELIPWWVGLLTHVVFGWTMAIVYPLGLYTPYRLQTEQQ